MRRKQAANLKKQQQNGSYTVTATKRKAVDVLDGQVSKIIRRVSSGDATDLDDESSSVVLPSSANNITASVAQGRAFAPSVRLVTASVPFLPMLQMPANQHHHHLPSPSSLPLHHVANAAPSRLGLPGFSANRLMNPNDHGLLQKALSNQLLMMTNNTSSTSSAAAALLAQRMLNQQQQQQMQMAQLPLGVQTSYPMYRQGYHLPQLAGQSAATSISSLPQLRLPTAMPGASFPFLAVPQ